VGPGLRTGRFVHASLRDQLLNLGLSDLWLQRGGSSRWGQGRSTDRFPLDHRPSMRTVIAEMREDLLNEHPTDKWPDHFGEDCPPASAGALDRVIFYLVEACPPTADDFKCAIDRGFFAQHPHCLRAGLSCAVEAAALERRRERVPRLRTHRIASASLSASHGRYEQTTSARDHYTMWLRQRALATAPTLFSCMGAGI
jgi:hypothetical protein